MITDERYKGVLSMALKPISKIAAGVQASTTLAIDSLFKQMKAEGKDVVGFGAGEPDFRRRSTSSRPVSRPLRTTRPSTRRQPV